MHYPNKNATFWSCCGFTVQANTKSEARSLFKNQHHLTKIDMLLIFK